uniref:Bm13519 n=1 Tax=Brugia malayi TaxID=6279 RepID=A0A1I9G3T1_BRUMA|nr:Bm13519 [Brugia malayi]
MKCIVAAQLAEKDETDLNQSFLVRTVPACNAFPGAPRRTILEMGGWTATNYSY